MLNDLERGVRAMSVNAMSNAALSRRKDFEPANTVPSGLRQVAHAASTPPKPVRKTGEVGAADGANATNTALQTLTTYIPTEILTLYVAAVAALGPLTINNQ